MSELETPSIDRPTGELVDEAVVRPGEALELPATPPAEHVTVNQRRARQVLAMGGEALGPGFDPEMFRIRPRRIVSWGIDGNMFQPNGRSVG